VYFPIKENIGSKYHLVKKELLADPNILSVTAQYYLFTSTSWRDTSYKWEGQKPDFQLDMILNLVDFDYFKTLNLKISEGRGFSKEFPTDARGAFILNEEAIKQMGIKDPIGKSFTFRDRKGVIVGVVKNAYFRSLHHKIEPHVFFVLDDPASATQYGNVLVKINGENIEGSLAAINKAWDKVNIFSPFEYYFLEQTYDTLYKSEKQTGIILVVFTILAVAISCMGLFGLAAFMAEKRTHEIGVRKVLGASVSQLVKLLSKEFLHWVVLANVLAWPIAYFIMEKWLQHFAYKGAIPPVVFPVSACFALIIALLTVSLLSYKAATANPVDSLRNE
jgi:putative ABC transport system permease protein